MVHQGIALELGEVGHAVPPRLVKGDACVLMLIIAAPHWAAQLQMPAPTATPKWHRRFKNFRANVNRQCRCCVYNSAAAVAFAGFQVKRGMTMARRKASLGMEQRAGKRPARRPGKARIAVPLHL